MFKSWSAKRARSRARYRVYLKINRVYFWLFFAFFLVGVLLYTFFCLSKAGIDAAQSFHTRWLARCSGGIMQSALDAFCAFLPCYALSFTFGVTIYAPLIGGLCSVFSALYCGAYVRCLIAEAVQADSTAHLFGWVLGLFLVSPVLLAIYAFSAAVSIRLFTPKKADTRETDLPFGGTLFCAPYYEGSINLRFLASYLLIFAALAAALFAVCLIQAALICLI